ncbi:hypothetical protein A2442_03485 [Candidatus Campbellbacteria bacterium RIFOXYC2_FULL_35_25]|uniref:UDP-N-acetylglucosamine--N-acetylmuramyl-(pentapeptide) pyrophosphoryl-undecaprenol N-acetylglucosamine transferase n=1 Tax=Candidatus Campbellbacteria bacterium RIFOXYC2_FULL_35_25 TaxID=1797582 RepID=A0A1F5EHL9_9BACT|nr:MAG: hypothetical protein A2442_03485 [Candidatus Campbellbacteria bacterium RIFOXYC2_FULL_35_25]
MKIILTGGGSGGHFYPLMAVAEQVRKISEDRKLLQPKIYYVSDQSYDEDLLFKNEIIFKKLSSGKMRRYFSILNFFDFFKTGWATFKAIIMVFAIYPDVIFSNGGFGSFPILLAGRIFNIPIFVHISDSVPGKVVTWASKFAHKISIGFPETIDYLKQEKGKEKTAFTGNPVRRGLAIPLKQGGHEFLKLDKNVPTVLVLGGSQGAKIINDTLVDVLSRLVVKYQIIHQTGKNNFEEVSKRANLILQDSPYKNRYKAFSFLDLLALRMSVGASDLVISRAGAGSISEIAVWGLPSIIIPIENSAGNHQVHNAFSFARQKTTVVIVEKNLTSNLLFSEIDRILSNKELAEEMAKKAKEASMPDAADAIAREIVNIAVGHE